MKVSEIKVYKCSESRIYIIDEKSKMFSEVEDLLDFNENDGFDNTIVFMVKYDCYTFYKWESEVNFQKGIILIDEDNECLLITSNEEIKEFLDIKDKRTLEVENFDELKDEIARLARPEMF